MTVQEWYSLILTACTVSDELVAVSQDHDNMCA